MPLIVDYVTVPQLKSTLNIQETYADADIAAAITAASRSIDNECNRHFGLDAAANSQRFYTPTDFCSVEIDDAVQVTAVVIDTAGNGTFSTSWTSATHYDLAPYNAAAFGEPYTSIEVRSQSNAYLQTRYARSVRVTGQFGWPSVPAPIFDACTMLAHRLLKRKRESPYAVVGLGVDSTPIRISRTDPDVYGLIEPYTRRRMLL